MKRWIGKWWLLLALLIAAPAMWSFEFASDGTAVPLTLVTAILVAPLVFFGMKWKPEEPPIVAGKVRGDGGGGAGDGHYGDDDHRSNGGFFSDFFGGGDGGAGGGGGGDGGGGG